jgi:AcrR family transcriptional regulator
MAQPTGQQDKSRGGTDLEIRRVARELLVAHGRDAVTLRAIARELGITAPALYRYYSSFTDLIQHVVADICGDLADELVFSLDPVPRGDAVGQVYAICRRFRTWALAHPREFTLVFATPVEEGEQSAPDAFGRIFLSLIGRLLASFDVTEEHEKEIPAALAADLARYRATLHSAAADTGLDLPEQLTSPGAGYAMLKVWIRLYGQVAVEVFGRFPFPIAEPEPLFESMLAELVAEVGLTDC